MDTLVRVALAGCSHRCAGIAQSSLWSCQGVGNWVCQMQNLSPPDHKWTEHTTQAAAICKKNAFHTVMYASKGEQNDKVQSERKNQKLNRSRRLQHPILIMKLLFEQNNANITL